MTNEHRSMAQEYDREATATGWLGPEVAFCLAFKHISPGQTILDIGIGTGLGSIPFYKAGLDVYGMDISNEMLDACRSKGSAVDLQQHDLTKFPYPYQNSSIDHAVCVGVLQFFEDLDRVFAEVNRIMREGGIFVFMVGDRHPGESADVVVGPEHTGTGASVTLYRHSAEQITRWLSGNGFQPLESQEFTVFMDREGKMQAPARAYSAGKSRDL